MTFVSFALAVHAYSIVEEHMYDDATDDRETPAPQCEGGTHDPVACDETVFERSLLGA